MYNHPPLALSQVLSHKQIMKNTDNLNNVTSNIAWWTTMAQNV